MGWIQMIIVTIGLFSKIFAEVISYKNRRKELNEDFEINMKIFLDLTSKILINERDILSKQSRQARDIEDEIGRDLK